MECVFFFFGCLTEQNNLQMNCHRGYVGTGSAWGTANDGDDKTGRGHMLYRDNK